MATAAWRALGTSVVVGVVEEPLLGAVRAAVEAEIDALDRACSRFREDSDLAHLNRAGGAPVLVGGLLAEAIRTALRAAALTDGDVDPTVGAAMTAIGYDADFDDVLSGDAESPPRFTPATGWQEVQLTGNPPTVTLPPGTVLDLGATAKALGADRAARAAHQASGSGVIVSLGGDVAVAGTPPHGGWPVRVAEAHDAPDDAAAQLITLATGGLATSSSTARRWRRGGVDLHHVVDPRTGRPAECAYRTVSVAAATCVDANIAATASLVRGEAARDWLRDLGLPARLVAADGDVMHINGWPSGAELGA